MNPHLKRAITADKLLNRKKTKKVVSIVDKRKELEELEAEIGL